MTLEFARCSQRQIGHRHLGALARAHAPVMSTTSGSWPPIPAPTCRAIGIPSVCAFNDFYGALGLKGSTSDLVVSAIHARQRDNYDEQNFLGGYEIETYRSTAAQTMPSGWPRTSPRGYTAGLAEQQFYAAGALQDVLCSGCRPQHLHGRSLARPDRAQRLPRREHDDHQPRLRRLAPPRPLSAHLDATRSQPTRQRRGDPAGRRSR